MIRTVDSSAGWCGRGDKKRVFQDHKPVVCYDKPPAAQVRTDPQRLFCHGPFCPLRGLFAVARQVDRTEYDQKRSAALLGDVVQDFVVPKRTAKTWTMQQGDLCRVTLVAGSQVTKQRRRRRWKQSARVTNSLPNRWVT